MEQLETVAGLTVWDVCVEDVVSFVPTCPLCSESLLVLSGLVRCPRCGLMLCESCEGLGRF